MLYCVSPESRPEFDKECEKMRRNCNLIGDRNFYRKVLLVAVPIMIQNGITNFVSLLDNIMVGQVGTEQMSGVAIANQLLFIFNMCAFGAAAGAGILGAQFFGNQNFKGVRDAFRFKLVCCLIISAVFLIVFISSGDRLIWLFLHEGGNVGDLEATLGYGHGYMKVMFFGMIPFALTQAYSGTLRETGHTVPPMIAGIIAVLVNLTFNYILIFGKLGAPALGAIGAAIATVLSRFVELGIVVFWTHKNTEKNPFAVGVYHHFTIPGRLVKQILIVGTPLFMNEIMWSSGMAVLTQAYSLRGLEVIAAMNIYNTIGNLFNVVFLSLGSAVGIIIGQILGSGDLKRARDEDNKLIAFCVFCCVITGLIMFLIAPLFPLIYNTEASVQQLATSFIQIAGLFMPVFGFVNATYFTLRSGGKTVITFFFDSCFMWIVTIPIVFLLSRFTGLYIVMIFLICQMTDLIKCVIGFFLVKKGVWLQNIVVKKEE